MIKLKELVDAGVHFGHQRSRSHPNMSPYIWGTKGKIQLIDVSKTAAQLNRASKFLESVAVEGKPVLWVGTKKPAQGVIKKVADQLDMPYVNHRWVGGSLSNWDQVKKSVTRMLHYEDILKKSEKFPHYTKKELNNFKKMLEKLQHLVGGIRNLSWPIGAIVLVDVSKEQSAVKEAVKMGIPVVAIVDTNSDPSLIDYVIPANDDAPRSISLIIESLADAVGRGKKTADKQKAEQKAAKQAEAKKAAAQIKETVKETAKKDKPAEKKAEPKKAPAKKAASKTTETKKTTEKKVVATKKETKKAAPKKEASKK